MKECFHCQKEFDETGMNFQMYEDYTFDEDMNDIPILRELYKCPHCESWTE